MSKTVLNLLRDKINQFKEQKWQKNQHHMNPSGQRPKKEQNFPNTKVIRKTNSQHNQKNKTKATCSKR